MVDINDFTNGGNIIYAPPNDTAHGFIWTSFGLSTVGLVFSSAVVGLLILTAVLFEEWRQSYKNQILLQFSIARYSYIVVRYAFDTVQVFGIHKNGLLGYYDVYLLLYTEMAVVTWMFVFSKQMYDSLVKVIYVRDSRRLLKTSLMAWLIPSVVVSLLGLILYKTKLMLLKVFLIYFFVLKWPIVFANAFLLFSVMKSLKSLGNRKSYFIMIVMIYTFGFQQLLHDIYSVVYTVSIQTVNEIPIGMHISFVVFNIIALYQHPVATLFWLFGNERTRDLWKFKSNSSTFTLRHRPSSYI